MQKRRLFAHVVLGLLLTVQGLAVAASGVTLPPAQATTAAPPCHGDAAMPVTADTPAVDSAAADGMPCCEDTCTDMIGCVLGHIAVAAVPHVDAVAPAHVSARSSAVAPARITLPSHLRPPIVTHV